MCISQTIHSATIIGVDGHPIQVEVDLLRRLPAVSIVGLPDGAVRESADRVRSAIQNSGLQFPRKRVVVNLAPAGIKKSGTVFDLPIAVAILLMDGQIESVRSLQDVLIVGELSLSGELRPIRGALSFALLAKNLGCSHIVLPQSNVNEASVVSDITAIGCTTLLEVVDWISGKSTVSHPHNHQPVQPSTSVDMSEVKGHKTPKRVLEIAAAGGHNVLMIGSPGCGKSMLAKRLPTILPTLSTQEAIDCTRIHSCAGTLQTDGLIQERPFRAPHHSISTAGMVGTSKLLPGELSLAHNGVLFLDELAEYRRDVLESLRTPLEDGVIQLTRASGQVSFPAKCALIAAVNPCPCGWRFHPEKICRCTSAQFQRYSNKLSGPILDRIDLHIWVEPINTTEFFAKQVPESSKCIRQRVQRARHIQESRYQNSIFCSNADLSGSAIWDLCALDEDCQQWLIAIAKREMMSARSISRVVKVARTIADLAGQPTIHKDHVAEAVGYKTGSEVVQ